MLGNSAAEKSPKSKVETQRPGVQRSAAFTPLQRTGGGKFR